MVQFNNNTPTKSRLLSPLLTIDQEILPPPKGGTETVLVAEDNKEVRELIITVFMQKPVSLNELLRKVREVLMSKI